MRPIVSLFLIILAFPSISNSQSRELGIMVGVMGYRGDLDKTMYDTRFLEPGISAIYRRSYSNHWAFKAGLLYGHVKADDSKAEDFYSQNRNLNFRSHIIELSGQFEFNFFPYQTANPNSTFSPYLLCGLSVFHFNPKTKINDDWIELQPLGTEGQGTDASNKNPYKRTNLAFTFGGGFKFKIGRRFGLTLESGVRQTYTDYLDDVSTVYADPKSILVEYGKTAALLSDRSLNQAPGGNIGRQRGDTQRRDFYVFTGVQLTYTLSKKYIDACQPFRIKLW